MLFRLAPIVGVTLLWSCPAYAAESANWTVSGGLDLVSDYRFRGISQTGLNPAVQPTLTVSHESGFYATGWGSNISKTEGGARTEIDLSGGFAWDLGGASLDVSATYYIYPGNSGLNYLETSAALTYDAGPLRPHFALSYVPPQSATRRDTGGRAANVYVAAGVDWAVSHTPLTLSAQVGYERGFFDYSERGGKIDWQIGAAANFNALSVMLSYVDSNQQVRDGHSSLSGPGLVAQFSFSF